MATIADQATRLQRHFDTALETYDRVSLLDLAHTLRIWTELDGNLEDELPIFATSKWFTSAIPQRNVWKQCKHYQGIMALSPDKLKLPGARGMLMANETITPGVEAVLSSIDLNVQFPEYVEFGSYVLLHTKMTNFLRNNMTKTTTKRKSYTHWLDAEIIRFNQPDERGQLRLIKVSRKVFIKRVANILGGSHAVSDGETNGALRNCADTVVHKALETMIGGAPLPYFLLLKTAHDILANLRRSNELPL